MNIMNDRKGEAGVMSCQCYNGAGPRTSFIATLFLTFRFLVMILLSFIHMILVPN